MPNEKIQPQPLSGEEVQNALLYRIAESLCKSCHLHRDNAYSSFRADISIQLTLNDYGREQKDNHQIAVVENTGLPGDERKIEANVVMEPAPPNQVRVETGQDVPVTTVVEGKQVTRKIRYAARKAAQ